ncbi:winged helix-turn-helix domain-containing protein [Alteromonas lipotrueiana]|uniref:winged helix-turn-helix domain-containing protein n=1 Tax=Alteromonas lipotrueiana TaxID=2803815 RepID=UPI001C47EA26|nr:winged helix-turn-helix domain-containing protein [Alteromonas lipotrueiana]
MSSSTFLRYDASTHTVRNAQGNTKILSPQCAALLALLLEHPHAVVTRDHIRNIIWRHNVVSEDLINHVVYRLKKELKCLPGSHIWHIEAITKTGYRLTYSSGESQPTHYWLRRWRAWLKLHFW